MFFVGESRVNPRPTYTGVYISPLFLFVPSLPSNPFPNSLHGGGEKRERKPFAASGKKQRKRDSIPFAACVKFNCAEKERKKERKWGTNGGNN